MVIPSMAGRIERREYIQGAVESDGSSSSSGKESCGDDFSITRTGGEERTGLTVAGEI